VDLAPGTLVGERFEVRSVLGRGGMGVVHSALDHQSGQEVALKFLSRAMAADPILRERFQREAELTARVDGGPGVVRVFEIGLYEGSPYSALELCRGGDLADALKAGLERDRLLEVSEALARTLAGCHDQGIVHRDVKPQNVLFDDEGQPKLCDFGLAVDQAERTRLTQTNTILGTPSYMAPEQADDARQAGPPADVYALGALLYAGLAGRPPFVGSAIQVMRRVLAGPPAEPPSQVAPGAEITPDLDLLCARALASEAEQRPSALELAEDLARLRAGESLTSEEGTSRRLPALALILLVALFLAGGARAAWRSHEEVRAARELAMSLSDEVAVGLDPLDEGLRGQVSRALEVLSFGEGEEQREAAARGRLQAALVAGTAPEAVGVPLGDSRLTSLAEALALTVALEEEPDPKARRARYKDAWSRVEHGARKAEQPVALAVAREVLRRQYRAQVAWALSEADSRGAFGLSGQLRPRRRAAQLAGLEPGAALGWEEDLAEALDGSAVRWEQRLARYLPPAAGLGELKAPKRELEILSVLLRVPGSAPLPPKLQAVWRAWLGRWVAAADPKRPLEADRVAALATQLFDLSPNTWRDPEGLQGLLQRYLDEQPDRGRALREGTFFAILRVRGGTIRIPARRVVISLAPNREGLDERYPGSRALAYWDYQSAKTPAERTLLAARVVEGTRSDLDRDLQARVLLAEAKEAYSLTDEGTRRRDLPYALKCIRRARRLADLPSTLTKIIERGLELEWAELEYVVDAERARRTTRAAYAALEERLKTLSPADYQLYRTLRGAFWDHLADLAKRGGSPETALELALAAAKGDPADMPVDNVDLRARSWARVFEALRAGERWKEGEALLLEIPDGMDRQNPFCAGELALLLNALGRKEEARAKLQRGLSSYPQDTFLRDVAKILGAE
jgi:tetratricopeptide (TPR) repeat protein